MIFILLWHGLCRLFPKGLDQAGRCHACRFCVCRFCISCCCICRFRVKGFCISCCCIRPFFVSRRCCRCRRAFKFLFVRAVTGVVSFYFSEQFLGDIFIFPAGDFVGICFVRLAEALFFLRDHSGVFHQGRLHDIRYLYISSLNHGSINGRNVLLCTFEESQDLRKQFAGFSATGLVCGADLGPVMFDTSDIQIAVRTDDKSILPDLALAHIGDLFIICDMTVSDCLNALGIVTKAAFDHRHQGIAGLYIIGRPGQNDQVALISLLLHEAQRYGIRNAAVQQLPVPDFHDPGDERHGPGCPEPLKHLLLTIIIAQVIDGFSGLDIRADQIKFHGIFAEGFPVKRVKFFRNIVVAELSIEQIPRGDQRHDARIAGIFRKSQIISDRASVLLRFIVGSERRAGGNAYCAVKLDALLHENIQNACGKYSAETSAFQNQTCLHKIFLLNNRKNN